MTTTVFLDSFSGAIDDMPRKDQRDPIKVLSVLSKHPRFSVFDATANDAIANTLTQLHRDELITYPEPKPEYPWTQVEVTEKGKALLSADVLAGGSEKEGKSDETNTRPYYSIVLWPDSVSTGLTPNESQDCHDSLEAAIAVCRGIERKGLGGEGKIFPIATRVAIRTESMEEKK